MYKILVVDDEAKSCDFISELLFNCWPDAEITCSESPAEALEQMNNTIYDLVFTDIDMPEMSGLEMIRKIRRTDKTVFIVIISAYDEFEYAQEAIELNVSGYLLKPFSKEKVQRIVRKYVEMKEETAENQEFILVRKSDCSIQVALKEIVAVAKQNKHFLKIYTEKNILYNIRSSLADMYGRLPSSFVYINRQCVVNLFAIKKLTIQNDVILKNVAFVCSREHKKRLLVLLNDPKYQK